MAHDNRYNKKKNTHNFWYSPIFLFIMLGVMIGFSYNLIVLIQKERDTNKNKIAELNKLDQLRSQKDSLTKDINTLNNSEGIEATLRDKYQVVKPGEKMVVIVDDKNPAPATDSTTDHSFWGFIKRMFNIK